MKIFMMQNYFQKGFKLLLLCLVAAFLFTSCEDEENVAKYSTSSFVGKWEAYKKRTVTKDKSTNAIIDDRTVPLNDPFIVEMRDNGFSTIDDDPLTKCEWKLQGDKLNIGCADFYTISDYSPIEFVLFYKLTDTKTIIENYTFYRKVR